MRKRIRMCELTKSSLTALLLGLLAAAAARGADPVKVSPETMKVMGTVDPRYQSYNIEMVEVTGGRFWAPYGKAEAAAVPTARPTGGGAPGLDPRLFLQRPPIDLRNARLRKLAGSLGPAYVRVSGIWANSTYFHDSDDPPPAAPPAGFGGVLTRSQWRGVVDFSRLADARIVTSFAISPGVRDASGVWTPAEARKLVAFTRSIGGEIAAAEMFNEPNFAAMGGAPKGYDAAAYGKDFAVFLAFARKNLPAMMILGPGSVGEGGMASSWNSIRTSDLMAASGRGLDAFSYHFYGAVSKRCAILAAAPQSSPETALSEEWLSRTEREEAFYRALRDQYEPGKPMWITETAETACGGNLWASSFLDSFRYLDQLGRLARRGVQVVAHNTLAASDYGLIDEESMTPRPNYWAALLWRRLMDRRVLDPGAVPAGGLHLYAHCLRDHPGGVALLAINTSRDAAQELDLPGSSERYTLTAPDLLGTRADLNGRELKLQEKDELPSIEGSRTSAGRVRVEPASISFFALPSAGNAGCR